MADLRSIVVLGWLLGATGCPTLDVSQPIALLPDPTWIESERDALRGAASCWNTGFGTQLELGASDGTWQQVQFSYNDFVCLFAGARTEPTLPVEVRICSHGLALSPITLYDVLLHEIGHVLNIRAHADDPDAVMYYTGEGDKHAFTDEDCRLFVEANPDFSPAPPGRGSCRCPPP